MKVSDKIKIIIEDAHLYHGYLLTNHINDDFSISIYNQGEEVPDEEEWQVALLKPSNEQLARGQFDSKMTCTTQRLIEQEVRFLVYGKTIMQALNRLHDRVMMEPWD